MLGLHGSSSCGVHSYKYFLQCDLTCSSISCVPVTCIPFRNSLLLSMLRNELMLATVTVLDLSIVCSSQLSHLTSICEWSASERCYLKQEFQFFHNIRPMIIVCCVTWEEAHYQTVGPLSPMSSWYSHEVIHFTLLCNKSLTNLKNVSNVSTLCYQGMTHSYVEYCYQIKLNCLLSCILPGMKFTPLPKIAVLRWSQQ